MLALLLAVLSVGAATGVQRTVLSLYSSGLVGGPGGPLAYLLIYLPILSFGLLKGTVDLAGGWLSDRLGRRWAAVLGSGIYLAGAAAVVCGRGLETLVAANLLIGGGEGMLMAAAMIALSDVGTPGEQAFGFGLMEGAVYGGYGVGSVLAGYVASLRGYHDAFWISLLAAAAAFAAAAGASDTRSAAWRKRAGSGPRSGSGADMTTLEVYRRCLRSWTLRAAYFLGHLAKFSDALIWGAFPLYLASLGFGEDTIGWVQGAATFSWAASMPLAGRLSDRLGRKVPAAAGLGLKALGIAGVYYGAGAPAVIASAAAIGVGVGMYYPIMPAISADVVPSGVRGRALGLYRSLRDYGYFTGALALALMSSLGMGYAFLLTVALLGAGVLVVALGVKETRPYWPAYEQAVRHAETVFSSVRTLRKMVEAHASGDRGEVERLAPSVKELEAEADGIRLVVDRILWLSPLKGQDKADFARLVARMDRIAAYALGSSRRLVLIDPARLSDGIRELLVKFVRGLELEVETLVGSLRTMGVDLEGSIDSIERVGEIESELDSVHGEAMEELDEHGERLDVLTLLNLRDLIEFMEYAADVAEDAADVMRVIVFKHSAWSA